VIWDRGAGISLIPPVVLWLLFSAGRPSRRTFALSPASSPVAIAHRQCPRLARTAQ
jgi:hypothetical protein